MQPDAKPLLRTDTALLEPLIDDARCVGSALLWCFGWFSLYPLGLGEPAPYLLTLALGVHSRVASPLGQLLPLQDMVLGYIAARSLPFCVLGSLASWWHLPKTTVDIKRCLVSGCYGVSALSLALGAYRRRLATIHVKSVFAEVLQITSTVVPSRLRQPLLSFLHPYFYWFYGDLPGLRPGSRVRVVRLSAEEVGCPSLIDIWYSEEVDTRTSEGNPLARPVFFFIHGGAWRGGEARLTIHAPLLQSLAAKGYFVVSCEYRKSKWPEQLDDCLSALHWVLGTRAAELGADARDITMAGPSAGGHLVSLLMHRLLLEPSLSHVDVRALVLFYPALDPGDSVNTCARFPVSLPFLRAKRGQSMLAWFFERAILRDDALLWPSAELVERIRSADAAVVDKWPPTLVLHGDHDCVVPLAHSRHFLCMLASPSEPSAHLITRPCDALVVVPGGRHGFEVAPDHLSAALFVGVEAWMEHIRLKRAL